MLLLAAQHTGHRRGSRWARLLHFLFVCVLGGWLVLHRCMGPKHWGNTQRTNTSLPSAASVWQFKVRYKQCGSNNRAGTGLCRTCRAVR